MQTIIILLIMICAWALPNIASAERILFIPLDNRPVCYEYVLDTMRKAKVDIKTPPPELLPSSRANGDVEGMLTWLEREAPQASAVVMSTDALIYGGLVGSRTHQIPLAELDKRVERLLAIVDRLHISVYAYSTIMRTPRMSSGRVEPPYYGQYGAQIFRYTQLQDMEGSIGLSHKQRKEYAALKAQIPADHLADWQARRDKNLAINKKLIEATKADKFSYFILGKDDTMPFSASHRESVLLSKVSAGLGKDKYINFVGADQLGMILCMRAITDFQGSIPFVYAQYNQGVGTQTVPTYEDSLIGDTVEGHIWALGGYPTRFLDRADLVLMVNTPIKGKTLEAASPENTTGNKKNKPEQLLARSRAYMQRGYPVAMGDVAYGNGSDNALVKKIIDTGMTYQFAAYAGWNTASNTLGYAMVQGLLAKQMTTTDKNQVLLVRYADEWAYQANVRGQIYSSVVYPQNLNGQDLGKATTRVQAQVQKTLRSFVAEHLQEPAASKLQVTLPWERMFEVYVHTAR